MKRIETIAVMLLAAVSTVLAEDFKVGNMFYSITSPTTVMLDKWESASGEVTIDEHVTYKGYDFQVTALGSSCFRGSAVQRVVVPASVKSLGFFVFKDCPVLEEVMLPEGIETVPSGMFSGCTKLKSFTFPSAVRKIESSAFSECSSLAALDLPEGLTEIGEQAFSGSGIRQIVLPESVAAVGSQAFQWCTALESVTVKGEMDVLGDNAFSGCTALQSIAFEQTVGALGDGAFKDCTSLGNVRLPEGLTRLSMACFRNCSSLQNVVFPSSLRVIGLGCFGGCALKEVTLPEGIETIQMASFEECPQLNRVSLPRTTTSIEDFAFSNCTSLTEITIPENVTSIGRWAFSGCEALGQITCRSTNLNSTYLADNTFDDRHYETATVTVPLGQKAAYAANGGWSRFKYIEEQDLGVNYNLARVYVGKHGAFTYDGNTYVGDMHDGNPNQYVISYEEGCDHHITIVPDEGYDFDFSINDLLPGGWREPETYLQGSEVHFGQDSRPDQIVINFSDLYAIVTIRQGEGGCFQLKAQRNHQYQYRAFPLDGWQVHSITYDGVDMTSQMDGQMTVETPPLSRDVTLNIAFEQVTAVQTTETVPNRLHVYGSEGTLCIENATPGEPIRIYTIDGVQAGVWVPQSGSLKIQLPKGRLYIVSTPRKSIKLWL